MKPIQVTPQVRRPIAIALLIVAGLALGPGAPSAARAQDGATRSVAPSKPSVARVTQHSYETPEAAVTALVDAVQSGDAEAIAQVLGRGAGRVLWSGDAQADAQARSDFLAAQQQASRVEMAGDGSAVLHIGAADWALPFPIVKTNDRWRFDTRAGLQQYLDRQIGANELNAIAVLDAYVQAEREYVLRDRDRNGLLEYAQRMVSSEGQQDGLYWPTADGEPLSPMGARFALANLGRLRGTAEAPQPLNGYFFRPLTAQGPAAEDGAYDYLVKGRQIGGYALIATPARWGVSGVMTFIVNHDGVVYSKNLGRDTTRVAARIARFNPDASWTREAPKPAAE